MSSLTIGTQRISVRDGLLGGLALLLVAGSIYLFLIDLV